MYLTPREIWKSNGSLKKIYKIIAAYTVLCCVLVVQSCLTLCHPMDCSTPGFPVLPYLRRFAEIHVHWVSDAIQLSHPLSPTSPPVLTMSIYQQSFVTLIRLYFQLCLCYLICCITLFIHRLKNIVNISFIYSTIACFVVFV